MQVKKSLSNQESAILLGRYLFLELATSTWAQNKTFFSKKETTSILCFQRDRTGSSFFKQGLTQNFGVK